MQRAKLILAVCCTGLVWAQNVGIGTSTPTERLHVAGNLRVDNAFMPGNQAGAVGNILLSQGAGAAPAWLPNGDAGTILSSQGAGANPQWIAHPVCSSGTPTLNRFIKVTSTNPPVSCNSTLEEETNAPHRIWNADGGIPANSAKVTLRGLVAGATDALWAYSTANNGWAIHGNAAGPQGIGIFGLMTGTDGAGVRGSAVQSTSVGVLGQNSNANGIAGHFVNTAQAAAGGQGIGVVGTTAQPIGAGVVGTNSNPNGTGVVGAGNNAPPYTLPTGAGGAFTGTRLGAYAFSTAANGTGVMGVGNNSATSYILPNGSGGAFTGTGVGMFAIATTASGTGVMGVGNNLTTLPTLPDGSGGAFAGTNVGLYTVATQNSGTAIYAVNNAPYNADATGVAGAFVSRAGWGSTLVAILRNDASLLPAYYPNTALNAINMRADAYPWGVVGAVANGGASATGIGVVGINTSGLSNAWGVFANGRLGATGNKLFFIDHPLDPKNKFLAHFTVEGPEAYTIYRGVVTTDASGRAVVQLPSYFEALNRPGDYHYSLTCIGTFAQAIVEEEIQNNRFVIRTDKPNVKVAWTVTGVRNDVYARHFWMPDEVEKSPEEKGKYLIPELFGKGPEYGIFSSRLREVKGLEAQALELKAVSAAERKIANPLPALSSPKDKLLNAE